MSHPYLKYFIDEDLIDVIKETPQKCFYKSYPIHKSNGSLRWLDAPHGEMKEVQDQLLNSVLNKLPTHPSAVGFKLNESIPESVKVHVDKELVINLDLKDFFSSIPKHRVRTFTEYMLSYIRTHIYDGGPHFREDLELLTHILTYKHKIPQGAPTSPALTNIICMPMDKEIQKYADEQGLIYTRYPDDMTLSSEADRDASEVISNIMKIVKSNGMKVNRKKIRARRSHQRQKVTGVVVNERTSVPKWKWRNFRAKLHNLEKSGKPIEKEEYQKLVGYAEWIRQLHPKRGQSFLQKIGQLNLSF